MKPFVKTGFAPGTRQRQIDDLLRLHAKEPQRLPQMFGLAADASLAQIRARCEQVLDDDLKKFTLYINDRYQVAVYDKDPAPEGFPRLIHLSIKRIDRESIHDWRDLQEIKNLLVGPEHEAVELYPAESRRVDSANQYHLYVLDNSKIQFPFGFTSRFVVEPTPDTKSKQRPFEKENP